MYIPTYNTLISKLESILRYIHVIPFWKWETKSDMTVKSWMINSRKIFMMCVLWWYMYITYTPCLCIVLLQTNYTASSLPAQPRYRTDTEQSPQYTSTTIPDHVGNNHLTKTFSHIGKIDDFYGWCDMKMEQFVFR